MENVGFVVKGQLECVKASTTLGPTGPARSFRPSRTAKSRTTLPYSNAPGTMFVVGAHAQAARVAVPLLRLPLCPDPRLPQCPLHRDPLQAPHLGRAPRARLPRLSAAVEPCIAPLHRLRWCCPTTPSAVPQATQAERPLHAPRGGADLAHALLSLGSARFDRSDPISNSPGPCGPHASHH